MHRCLQSLAKFTGPAVLAALCAIATGAEKKEAPPAVAAKPHPLLGVVVPEAEFVNEPTVGKDPFYPESNRRLPRSPVLTKATVTEVNRVSLLTLRGVSGQAPRRIALINNGTFVAGEEGTVRTAAGLLKIRVVSVEDKIVTVMIDGDTQPRELLLNDKIPDSIQIQTSQVEK